MSGPDPLAACRNIPLDRVAAALGYRRDPADRGRFKREGSVISIDGEKFFGTAIVKDGTLHFG